ncbi:MAG: DUF1924 domain-containing protein [Pseudolabrys sp.]
MKLLILAAAATAALAVVPAHAGDATAPLLEGYRAAGAGPFDAAAGRALWTQRHPGRDGERSCSTCHTANLRQAGRHARTGKAIQPMAPSVNVKRLTDAAKIEKWFTRNCKWTLGRACTAQEKGDILTFIKSQ